MAGKVAVVMGSKSDTPIAEKAEKVLSEFGIQFETVVISSRCGSKPECYSGDRRTG